MPYGVQYYPEQWPEERWPVDAEMMKRADECRAVSPGPVDVRVLRKAL